MTILTKYPAEVLDVSMSTDGALSQDVLFEMLHSPRRRQVLAYLSDRDGPVDLDDVILQVAAWENDTSVDAVSESERKRIYVSLYQTHMPKLDDAGLVEYDDEEGTVELTDLAREAGDYVSDDSDELPWYYAYLGLSVVGAAALLAAQLDVPGLSAVGTTTTGVLVVGAFVTLTGVVVYSASAAPEGAGALFRTDGQDR
jgi:DNA-binding transcriptional ArsR family regulator